MDQKTDNAAMPVETSGSARQSIVHAVTKSSGSKLMLWGRALRIHQWTKNLLIFVPLFTSHRFTESILALKGFLAFLLFCLCASSVYILNDLLDLTEDRQHPTKQRRPFASGALSIKTGLVLMSSLLFTTFVVSAYTMPIGVTVVFAFYFGLTFAYSISLKRIVVIDVIVLAFLYTLRIIAGSFVFDVVLTFWLLAFSVFLFLSLAMMKRYTELRDARIKGLDGNASGRGYHGDDLEMISSLGGASGFIAIMVLALYVQDGETASLYTHAHALWLACPVMLYWISRVWLIAHRGRMHDDPVTFAISDGVSWLVVLLLAAIFSTAL